MACIQATTAGADEALMLDPHGFVATCNSTHFFIVTGGITGGGGVLTSAGGNDGFLASFDTNGLHLWAKRFGNNAAQVANSIALEATLSFLGLGVPPPAPSWGTMIEEARDLSTLQAAPHALIFPGVAIALTVLAFNFIGDGLREYLDPRQRAR